MDLFYKAKLLNYDEYRALDKLSETIKDYCESESKQWNDEYNRVKDNDSVLADNAISHLCIFETINGICDELIIVGLYKKVELTRKQLIKLNFPNEDVSKLYQHTAVSKFLDKIGISCESLAGVSAVDELRCLCNAIKHEGSVTEALSKYPGWVKGDALDGLITTYKRLVPEIQEYLTNLSSKLSETSKKAK